MSEIHIHSCRCRTPPTTPRPSTSKLRRSAATPQQRPRMVRAAWDTSNPITLAKKRAAAAAAAALRARRAAHGEPYLVLLCLLPHHQYEILFDLPSVRAQARPMLLLFCSFPKRRGSVLSKLIKPPWQAVLVCLRAYSSLPLFTYLYMQEAGKSDEMMKNSNKWKRRNLPVDQGW